MILMARSLSERGGVVGSGESVIGCEPVRVVVGMVEREAPLGVSGVNEHPLKRNMRQASSMMVFGRVFLFFMMRCLLLSSRGIRCVLHVMLF
jgi:hypothetical protein